MARSAAWLRRRNTYDILSLLLLIMLLLLIAVNLSMYPVFLDIPYHMAVTSGFQEAGGVTTWDFWDYAPEGRPHIYPPLLHVSMSLLMDMGLSMEFVATLVCLIMFPLILLCLWWSMRKLFGPRAAFYSLVLAGVPYMFFWQSGVTIAASLVLALTPLIMVMVEEDRKIAAAILLAMCLYSHLVMGHLAALAIFIYMLHRREKWRGILTILCSAYLLYLPWGIVVLTNLNSFSTTESMANGNIILHLFLWLTALAGFIICYVRKKQYYLLPSYLISMVPIVFFYTNRFWEGHVFLPLAMLGAVALDRFHAFLERSLGRRLSAGKVARAAAAGVLALLLALVFLVDPVLAYGSRRPSDRGPDRENAAPPGGYPPGVGSGGDELFTPSAFPQGQDLAAVEGSAPYPGLSYHPQPGVLDYQGYPPASQGYPPTYHGYPPTSRGYPPSSRSLEDGALPPSPYPPPHMDATLPELPPGGGRKAGRRPLLEGLKGPRDEELTLDLLPTTVLVLLGLEAPSRPSDREQEVFGEETTALMRAVEENSEPGDIVFTSDPRLGDLIYAKTGRYSMLGMFNEVQPEREPDPYRDADLLVIQAPPRAMGGREGADEAISRATGSEWTEAADLGGYALYVREEDGGEDAAVSSAALPLWAAYLLLFAAIALLVVDAFRRRPGSFHPLVPPPPRVYPSAGGRPRPGGYALAVVPAYNEEGTVGRVVRDIGRACAGVDVLVVDDGSEDGTGVEALEAGALVMRMERNLGVGEAVRRGLAYAYAHGYRFAVRLDGDGQHPPDLIPRLLRPLERGESEVVVGSRFLRAGGEAGGVSLPRRMGISYFRILLDWRTSRRFTDPTSGFRAYSRRAMRLLMQNRPLPYPEVTSLRLFAVSQITVKEVAVEMEPRHNGKSSLRGLKGLVMVWGVTLDLLGPAPRPSTPEDGGALPTCMASTLTP